MSTFPAVLCAMNDLAPESIRRCVVPGLEPLAVVRHGENVYALSDRCSHGMASLSEGEIENGRIYCPYHSGAFELATGAAVEKPCTIAIRAYKVEVQNDTLMLMSDCPMSGVAR